MSLPTPHVIHVRRRVENGEDAHGNPRVVYAWPEPWHVHGIAPGANRETPEANRDASHVLWTVYAPVSDEAPGELDRVEIAGVEYDVEGRPSDWTLGPWDHPTAGLVVELIAKEG